MPMKAYNILLKNNYSKSQIQLGNKKFCCKTRKLSSLTIIVYINSPAIRTLFLIDWFFTSWPFFLRLPRLARGLRLVFIGFIYILLKRNYKTPFIYFDLYKYQDGLLSKNQTLHLIRLCLTKTHSYRIYSKQTML